MASAAWDRQLRHLADGSPYYMRKFRDAGIGASKVSLKDIAKLPFTTKDDLKKSVEEELPFGTNAGVPEEIGRAHV